MYKAVSSVIERGLPYIAFEYNNFLCNPARYQIVRWKRKPRWLPVAKSKMFRVPERKKIPREEYDELKTLYNNYRTEMKSINKYMAEKLQLSMTGDKVIAELARKQEEDHQNSIKLNMEWNEQVRQIREARIAAEKEKEMEEIMRRLELKEKEEVEMRARVENIVREEKEKAKYYITSKNIDSAIEEALTKEKDYNFAIDLEFNKYEGRQNRPNLENQSPEQEKIAQSN